MKVADLIKDYLQPDFEAAKSKATYSYFDWYIGYADGKEPEVFRFAAGSDPVFFKKLSTEKKFVSVDGPFKTKKAAQERISEAGDDK